ncbi:major facilitator superfamily domain-containing protein [Paraphoma chrysanthemicola]|uniref:Major facilitator superfamily domain-containing protein n=1 Tax=Paraphoma chrysanthemicola TaxID=798071 RepID=A0A8K0VWT3_9PLEO|nr:major facilitator superfamily domain-containing protein [Paraphoma chrysanthemicola]
MGLWVLEPKSNEPVPGTVHLQREGEKKIKNTEHLKHGTGRHANLVLAPQPSDSPNDPLNWSQWHKWYQSIFLSMGTGLMAGTHNFVNPANALLARHFKTNISTISRSVSIILLTLGISAVATSPAARIWGKRPVFLVSNVVAIIGYVIVVARSNSLVALYVGRAIHGFGIAALEYLVSSTIGDLFFVHERAFHLAIWHYALSGGNAIGQVIASQIVQAQGWVWPFKYTCIVIAVYTIILFFTCSESTYNRAASLNTDMREEIADDSSDDGALVERIEAGFSGSEKSAPTPIPEAAKDVEKVQQPTEPRITYWQSLKVYNGRFSDESLLRAFITPWSAYLLPAVLWTAYAYGCTVAFATSFSTALAQIFTKPPYRFTTSQVGLTVLSAFVGATLGNMIGGPLCDWLVKYMSKKNKGVYEPEFRIVLTVPAFVFGLMGFWGFGLSLEAKAHWMAPVFFFGLATFSGSVQALVSNAYLLDCHRAHAQDGYAAVTIARGLFSFTMTFVINSWIERDGLKTVYFWIGTLHGISCIWGMVLYVYGKRIRLAVSKNRWIQSKLGTSRDVKA